jgi:hypothetical protein
LNTTGSAGFVTAYLILSSKPTVASLFAVGTVQLPLGSARLSTPWLDDARVEPSSVA